MVFNLQLFKVDYDPDKNYTEAIREADARGDAAAVKQLNKEREAKIAASNGSLDQYKNDVSAEVDRANSGYKNTSGKNEYAYKGYTDSGYLDDNSNTDYRKVLNSMLYDNSTNIKKLEEALNKRYSKADETGYQFTDSDKEFNNRIQTYIDELRADQEQKAWEQEREDLLDKISELQNAKFNYDYTKDPLYDVYKEIYQRQGEEAQADTLADASALTGGLSSSYAITAAQQAKNNYMQKIADIIPTLEAAAYDKFVTGQNTQIDLLDRISTAINQQYQKYRDAVSDQYSWNRASRSDQESDRNYDFNMDQFDYSKEQDQKAYDQWLAEFDEKKRQALVDEAIAKGQLSVSQGNLALSRAKFEYEKQNGGNSNNQSQVYQEQLNALYSGDLTLADLQGKTDYDVDAAIDEMGLENFNKLLKSAQGNGSDATFNFK